MHIKKVTLNNFRCFDRLELDLHPRLTVLVAENGGGKTSALDGISLGFSAALRALSSANQRLPSPGIEDLDFRLSASPTGKQDVRADYVQVIMETMDGQKWDVWKGVMKGAIPPEKFGQSALHRLTEILDTYKSDEPDLLPIFAYYGARRGWIDIPQRIRRNKYNAVDYDYPTSALYGCLDALTDFKEMMKWFDTEEVAEFRRQRESTDYEGSPVLDCVREAIPYVLGDSYYQPHFDGRHKFMVKSRLGPGTLRVSQLSQGYQSMLALAMDFSRRLALGNRHLAINSSKDSISLPNRAIAYARQWDNTVKTDDLNWLSRGPLLAPAVMLVDEIDLHLHPSWQQRVLHDLMQAFPFTQFIVTTHSPQVVSTVRRENIRILQKTDSGKWEARMPERNTYAHANSLVLESVMGGHAYPPSETVDNLREYQRLVGNDAHDTERARELRSVLEAEWGKADSELLLVDVTIRKNETLRKLRN